MPFVLFCVRPLEHVTQRELHDASGLGLAEGRLCAGEIAEALRRCATEDERIGVQTGAVKASEPLRVRDVEDFPTEGKCLSFSQGILNVLCRPASKLK